TLLQCLFKCDDEPRHPCERREYMRSHQAVPDEAVESEDCAGNCGGQAIPGPAPGEKIHSHAGEKEMTQAKYSEGPGQREHEIKQRRRVKRHRVPLGEEGNAATAGRIPERKLATPEGFPQV